MPVTITRTFLVEIMLDFYAFDGNAEDMHRLKRQYGSLLRRVREAFCTRGEELSYNFCWGSTPGTSAVHVTLHVPYDTPECVAHHEAALHCAVSSELLHILDTTAVGYNIVYKNQDTPVHTRHYARV